MCHAVPPWATFEITRAASFTRWHTPGALTLAQVPTLTAAQVAIITGDNSSGIWPVGARHQPINRASILAELP